MLKILLCCGGGFSSSYLTQKMQNEIKEKGLNRDVSIDFYPFGLIDEIINDYDIVMCCPHLNINVKQYVTKHHPNKPVYVLPPRMYGMMEFDEIYQDAKDVMMLYQKDSTNNPFVFPGEENNLRVKRNKSYRKSKG